MSREVAKWVKEAKIRVKIIFLTRIFFRVFNFDFISITLPMSQRQAQ